LRREARAMAALAHPGICTVYALEETDRGLFIATEYIEGQTLREEMAGTDRPPSLAVVSAAHELAAALACAHGRGIIHRDVKPENVIRGTDGRLKMLDFGLAVDGAPAGADHPDRVEHRLTEPGMLVGTPGYMAPEQLRGEPADARSDVFALGVLLYEYACGVHPFQARDSLGVAARVLEHDPVPIASLRPEVPAAVAAAIERCLRKRPAERWPSAVELALALAAPAPLVPRAAGEPRTLWWRTHQLGMIALYAVAAGLAWHIKEWTHGAAAAAFVAIGLAGAINGVLRGHLLFTWWTNRDAIGAERSRTGSMTLVVDLAMAAVLAAAGILAEPARPLAATVTIALAAAIALARTIVEPATTRAAFDRTGA
ncbi:MAG: serine/threonine-protein kinase, partial [Acidobacteriota bacterium]